MTSFEEREKKTFKRGWREHYARSKSAVRRIPDFEAVRDRKFLSGKVGNERKGAGSEILPRQSRATQATRVTETKAIV